MRLWPALLLPGVAFVGTLLSGPSEGVPLSGSPPDPPINVIPADGATAVPTSPTLTVQVTDPEADLMDVTFYGRGGNAPIENFTIVALPDTQNYADANQSLQWVFNAQAQWIVDNKEALNIVFVSELGDCVQHGNAFPGEWVTADAAFSLLEDPVTTQLSDGIPYGIAVGNHDQSPLGVARSGSDEGVTTSGYNAWFGRSRFLGREYYGGSYDFGGAFPDNNDNHYQLFSAAGMDFIVVHLEYDLDDGPERADVLTWADALLQTHSNRRAIVVSHYIQGIHPGLGGPNPDFESLGPQGQAIYDALKGNPNFFLMLSGHVAGVGRREETYLGNTVHSILADYQLEPNGGDGWLRTLEFSPATDEIRMRTYSPTLLKYWDDPATSGWRELSNHDFTLAYDMAGFVEIGTVSGVPNGGFAAMPWPGLDPGRVHEWYAVVSDGTSGTTGTVWSFTTACSVASDCDDGNACTDDDCNSTTEECGYTNNEDPCDDGDPCTESDACNGGVCGGMPVADCCVFDSDCEDANSCTDDTCVANVCQNAPIVGCCTFDTDCDDGDPCTADTCSGANSAALSFDGIDDHVDFGNDPSITLYGADSLTVVHHALWGGQPDGRGLVQREFGRPGLHRAVSRRAAWR